MKSYVIDFRSFFCSNVCIQCYKFPSKHSFCWIPQISCVFIFIQFFDPCVIYKCTVQSPCTLAFSSYLLLLTFYLIPLWSETTLFKIFLNKSVFSCTECALFGDVSYELEENAYSSIVQWYIDINYIHLIDDIVEFSSVLSDFLPPRSVCLWGDVDIYSYDSRFVYSFVQFCQFLPHFIWYSVIRNTHIENCYVFLENLCLYDYTMCFFISENFHALRSSLSDI